MGIGMKKQIFLSVIASILIISSTTIPAYSVLLQTLNNPTPALNDNFGNSVSLSGNNVLVGAFNDDTGFQNAGSAYLFDATTGNLLQTINNPAPGFNDEFGTSVSLSGNNVLVGAPNDNTGASNAGSAYLFDATTGNLLQTINNPTSVSGDLFGFSVSVSGNNVLVGAPLDDTGATDAGLAYLFDASNGNLLQPFNNPTPAQSAFFGSSVSVSGNNVLVGAPRDDTGASQAGLAYLFDATTGNLLQTFNNPTPAIDDEFGFSVSLSGNNVLVGAHRDDTGAFNAGSAYLFDATTGNLLQTINNPIPTSTDEFGTSVSVSGNNVLVGAHNDDTGALNAGSAYLFDATTGNLLQTINNPTPVSGDNFGNSVSVSGNNVLVGAFNDDTGATNAGSAYLFSFSQLVGGTILPIDSTSLILAGAQMTAAWMIPVIIAGVGIAIVITRKF